ncbi:MAG: hypothetical protein IPO54_02085 [Micavibrio sp.]|nr:hypothetical protein [Micavibrio sp.]
MLGQHNLGYKNNTDIVRNLYVVHALNQMPRLLSRMDREAPSKTYGAFDRTYWSWKFTDFAGSRFQEAIYALTWFYTTPFSGNIYNGNERVHEWIIAGFKYWQSLQHADGSFDEAYPYERSLAATAFTGFYLGEAFFRLSDSLSAEERSSFRNTFLKAGDWLCKNDEHHGVLSNHLAAAAAALEVIARITGEKRFSERAKYFIDRILSRQSSEGWYEEYGGVDFGYQTHGTFYLARYWQLRQDAHLLESLKKSVKFISHFIHPNGTLGGEYGSRNTSFYFPAGFEILSQHCPEAAAIAAFMRNSVAGQNAAGLAMMDAYNFCPLLNNYLFAHDAASELKASPLPFHVPGHHAFPKAGLVVHVTDDYQAIFSPSKGGILKIYDIKSKRLAFSDCGYWSRVNNLVVSSQSFSLENLVEYGADEISVKANFVRMNQKIMSPFLFLGFRGFMITIGRQKNLALFIKNLLVKTLVKKRRTIDIMLERKVTFFPSSVTIEDRLSHENNIKKPVFHLGSKFSTIHMGSARYYQPDELEPPLLTSLEGNSRKFTWKAS